MDDLILRTLFYGLFRWLHLVAVVVAIGGTFLLRYVVDPAASDLGEDTAKRLSEGVRRQLAMLIPAAIGVLLVSGIVNIVRAFSVPPSPPVGYHMVLGIKIILAFGMFGAALMLVIPSSPPNAFQRRRRFWLTMNSHMGLLLIALSVALRFLSGK